jgi:hypothetical protein
MTDLFTALRNWFISSAELTAACPGGVYLTQAPPTISGGRPIPKPYAVMVDLGNSFEFTSGDPYIDTHGVQFSIFSITQAQGETARAALRSRFDAKRVPIGGDPETLIVMMLPVAEETTREDDNIWHTRIDYTITVHRSL